MPFQESSIPLTKGEIEEGADRKISIHSEQINILETTRL
jgi:hypothetical protein